MAKQSLYDRLGGEAAVQSAVELFYEKVLSDGRINHFFDHTDMASQRARHTAFLTMAFGGPNAYEGKDLEAAHAPLTAKGLNAGHFDAFAENLQVTLEQLGVEPDLAAEVMKISNKTLKDVRQVLKD